ncbi:MAG: xanthine dehydrogenase family protein molybdopterin-binding subunit, partial [Acidimicrobiales bacterium]
MANLHVESALHVVFVRSVMAHARIRSIDTEFASSLPGVVAVVTGDQLGSLTMTPAVRVDSSARRHILPMDRVRFVGEAIVAVVAASVAQATDAAEAVLVDYDPLPPVVGVQDALRDETILFDGVGSNVVAAIPTSPAEIDFADCDVVVDHHIVNQRVAPVPLESRVGAADWPNDGRLTVWASCQGAGAVRNVLKDVYGLDDDEVRVIATDVGGGFGAKASPSGEELALPGLSRLTNSPVRWAETRSENLVAMVHGRGQNQHIRMGGGHDGRVTHYALHVVQDAGAHVDTGAVLPWLTMMMLTGTYQIDHAQFSSQSVVTNTAPVGAFRGAGRPEAAAAVERAI